MDILTLHFAFLFISPEGPVFLVCFMAFEDFLVWVYYSSVTVFVFAVYLLSWSFINLRYFGIHCIEHEHEQGRHKRFPLLHTYALSLFCW